MTTMLERRGGRIAYEMHEPDHPTGDAPLALLAPGMGDLRSTYRLLVPLLTAGGLRVVVADLRGHGDSDASFAGYGDEETAGDLVALIEHLGSPAVLVGNSMAAGAGVIAAADRPDLVRGLALLGPFVRDPVTSRLTRLTMRLLMRPPWARRAWTTYLPRLYAGRRPADLADHVARIDASLRRPAHLRAFCATIRISHAPAQARLDEVTAPVAVVMGADDPDFPDPAVEADWIGRRLQATRVLVLPEVGHYPQSQAPEATAGVVVELAQHLPHA